MVFIGVALEWWVIHHDWHDEMETWALWDFIGIVRSPAKPSSKKLWIERLSVFLVAAGIMGELIVGFKISAINGQLRTKGAELRSKSDLLLASVEHQVRLQGPRMKLLEANKVDFVENLKPFAPQKIIVIMCGMMSPPESNQLEQGIMNLIGPYNKEGAGWPYQYKSWSRCTGGATSNGGNLIVFSSESAKPVKDAAEALWDELNKMEISTAKMEILPRQESFFSFNGEDAPEVLAIRNPDSVVLLVGQPALFDLGWKRLHKQK